VTLLREHHEAIEADLLDRHWRLSDLFVGRLTWRELGIIVRGLPHESHTMTALRNARGDDEPQLSVREAHETAARGRWSRLEMLVADLCDAVARMQYFQLSRWGAENLPMPRPMARPGVPVPKTGRGGLTLAQRRELDPRMRSEVA
jgi:hypothetical protein